MIYKKSITLYNKFLIFNYLNQKLISGISWLPISDV